MILMLSADGGSNLILGIQVKNVDAMKFTARML